MTRKILLLLALGLTVPAQADVSDSGNLTIGGTGVIQGTMTVQGSAFSVGGATFTVAEGSVTLGGRLNVASTGIKWADGSTSTTAPSGAGNVLLTATQTFSGGNTFTSGINIGSPGSYLELNTSDGLEMNLSGMSVFAKSVDGASQSSGCVVTVGMSGNTPASFLRFTSTTTPNLDMATVQVRPGVLLESCAPGSFCRVGISGMYRAKVTNTSYTPTGGVVVSFSSTRCSGVGAGSPPSIQTIVGHFVSASDAAGYMYLSVGP